MSTVINSYSIAHPNTFNMLSGSTALAKELKSIEESIRLILTTAKGELFGDPDFGSRLYEYLYDQMDHKIDFMLAIEIVEALTKYEKRIVVKESDISVNYKDKTIIININYSLANINYRDTFTYITQVINKEALL